MNGIKLRCKSSEVLQDKYVVMQVGSETYLQLEFFQLT